MRIPEPYFENIPNIGDLIMDNVLFAYDYPILFICKTKEQRYYLCNCCDIYEEQRWLIAPISFENLKDLLNNRLTIREGFELAVGECCVATWSKGDSHEEYNIIHAKDFSPEDLPDAGEYLDAENNEYQEYLESVGKRIKERMVKNLITRWSVGKNISILKEVETSEDWNISVKMDNCSYASLPIYVTHANNTPVYSSPVYSRAAYYNTSVCNKSGEPAA